MNKKRKMNKKIVMTSLLFTVINQAVYAADISIDNLARFTPRTGANSSAGSVVGTMTVYPNTVGVGSTGSTENNTYLVTFKDRYTVDQQALNNNQLILTQELKTGPNRILVKESGNFINDIRVKNCTAKLVSGGRLKSIAKANGNEYLCGYYDDNFDLISVFGYPYQLALNVASIEEHEDSNQSNTLSADFLYLVNNSGTRHANLALGRKNYNVYDIIALTNLVQGQSYFFNVRGVVPSTGKTYVNRNSLTVRVGNTTSPLLNLGTVIFSAESSVTKAGDLVGTLSVSPFVNNVIYSTNDADFNNYFNIQNGKIYVKSGIAALNFNKQVTVSAKKTGYIEKSLSVQVSVQFDNSGGSGGGINEDCSITVNRLSNLYWEKKSTNQNELNYRGSQYTWWNGQTGTRDPYQPLCYNSVTPCNTQKFIDTMNTNRLCGASNWRLPTQDELKKLAADSSAMGKLNISTDVAYWSRTEDNSSTGGEFAYEVNLSDSSSTSQPKKFKRHVILVRPK